MRDSRNFGSAWAVVFLLGAAVAAGGCAGPRPGGLRFVSASAREDGGHYTVTALLENLEPIPFYLDTVSIEMTTFDGEGKVVSAGYPLTFDGTVRPGSQTRLPLPCPDRGRRIRSSRLSLKDARGRVVSEMEVAPIAGPDGEAPRGESDPGSDLPPLELKVLGRPE